LNEHGYNHKRLSEDLLIEKPLVSSDLSKNVDAHTYNVFKKYEARGEEQVRATIMALAGAMEVAEFFQIEEFKQAITVTIATMFYMEPTDEGYKEMLQRHNIQALSSEDQNEVQSNPIFKPLFDKIDEKH
jgi:hypothetical protein